MAQLEELLNGLYEGKRYLLTKNQMEHLERMGGWYMHDGHWVGIHSEKWGEDSYRVSGEVHDKSNFIGGTYREPVYG